MENKEACFSEIMKLTERLFLDHENPDLALKYARFFREGYDAYGIPEEMIRDHKRMLVEKYAFSPLEAAQLGHIFLKTGKYEFGTLAVMLLKKFRPKFTFEVFQVVRDWFEDGVENWAHSDMICSKLTPVFLELQIVELEGFADWRSSGSKWTRRAVPVTMLYLRKTADPNQLLDFIEPMMGDREYVVQQGLGWFLKQHWVVRHREVEDFLFRHRNTAPRLIIQYATEKMPRDKRKRFRKDDKPLKPGKKAPLK